MLRAIIDIGTNTVKLLVADAGEGPVSPVFEADATTRLGEGTGARHRLSAAAIARTAKAVAGLVSTARDRGAQDVRAITTSAARDAVNCREFLDRVRRECGVTVAVVSGAREAELVFRGVVSDPAWAGQPLLVLDVGGGSAEAIQGRAGHIECCRSLPLGAVRLTEQFGESQADRLDGHLRRALGELLAGCDLTGRKLVGTGGTILTLAAVELPGVERERSRVDHFMFGRDRLTSLVARLGALPLAERQRVRGLPPERADIIVAGGRVFVVAMEILGASELNVSTRNLRYGALATRI